jgi:hypothetical protein
VKKAASSKREAAPLFFLSGFSQNKAAVLAPRVEGSPATAIHLPTGIGPRRIYYAWDLQKPRKETSRAPKEWSGENSVELHA